MTRLNEESYTTSSIAASSVLLAEWENCKNCCQTLTLEKQCILGLATEARKLREKLAERKKTDTALKTAPKSRGRNRATAADMRVTCFDSKLANAKASHSRLVEVATRSEAETNKARTNL